VLYQTMVEAGEEKKTITPDYLNIINVILAII
jgi:hypothetical protein